MLYNGKEEGGSHYSPLVRVDGQFLESTDLFISDCYYDEEVDKEEREIRGEANTAVGDNILVARSRLIELIKKEKQLEEIQAVVRGQAQPGGGEVLEREDRQQEWRQELEQILKMRWTLGKYRLLKRGIITVTFANWI